MQEPWRSRLMLILEVVLLEGQVAEQAAELARLRQSQAAQAAELAELRQAQASLEGRMEKSTATTRAFLEVLRSNQNRTTCAVRNLKELGRSLEECLPDYYMNMEASSRKRKRVLAAEQDIPSYKCRCPLDCGGSWDPGPCHAILPSPPQSARSYGAQSGESRSPEVQESPNSGLV